MIPRLRPFFGLDDLSAAMRASDESLPLLENALAKTLGFKHALLLSLGRTALYLYLNLLDAKGREVIVAVYNCRVVPSTVVYAGAAPRYVDAAEEGFNLAAEDIVAVISPQCAAVVLTSMYGYPFAQGDVELLRKNHPGVPLIGDCALALFSRPQGYYFADDMDVCFYAFGIGKQVSIVEGGLLTTNNTELYRRLAEARDRLLRSQPARAKFKRMLVFLGATLLFHKYLYRLLYLLSEETSVLASVKGSETAITSLMPHDWEYMPAAFQCGIGLAQVRKFQENRERRARIVDRYFEALGPLQSERLGLPPYFRYLSHFPVLSSERDGLQRHLLKYGIHSTNVFRELPWDLPLVKDSCHGEFPRARRLRDRCTLLPLFAQLDDRSFNRVVTAIKRW